MPFVNFSPSHCLMRVFGMQRTRTKIQYWAWLDVPRTGVEFAPDSPLEGDGFELPVPRRKSRGFPQHSGHCGGIGEALKRYHLMVQPFFFCASNHSIEPGWGRV
jgi:hypothetical protein